jgi:hypothetical protein
MYRGIADNSQRHPVHPRRLVDDAVAGAFCPGDLRSDLDRKLGPDPVSPRTRVPSSGVYPKYEAAREPMQGTCFGVPMVDLTGSGS